MRRPENPKNRGASALGRSRWYPYYAGYSPDFVRSVLEELSVPLGSVVLDPWNGSGTTTAVCALMGYGAIGLDLNPAMAVVAKARLLTDDVGPSLLSLQRAILMRARELSVPAPADDPLCSYFDAEGAGRLRAVFNAILALLANEVSDAKSAQFIDNTSSLAAFYLVVLFRVVRLASKRSRTRNPTWVRTPASIEKMAVEEEWLANALYEQASEMASECLAPASIGRHVATASIKIADSRAMPLSESSCDVVVTSPPYCTRIDYAVATRLELAVLGIGPDNGFEELRRRLIGSTLSPKAHDTTAEAWAPQIRKVLASIRGHSSKASQGYYAATFADYFSGLTASIDEMSRVLRHGAHAVVVVQDSNYKDIRIDLAALTAAQARVSGMRKVAQWNYRSAISMRRINSAASESQTVSPVESVLILQKS